MLCSTIIPTIGRPTLSRAVCSVINQEIDSDDFEVIVVNDSGKPLAPEAWMSSPRVKILHTNRHNRSVARNTGAAVARGRYLHFLDDDDCMVPGAFQALQDTALASDAGWIYGAFCLVDNQGNKVEEIHPTEQENCFVQMVASEWIPLQASWINSQAFFDLGGFASLSSLGGGYEDIHLARMIAWKYSFSRSANIVASIRYGDFGSTTDYNNMFLQNRVSREKSLDLPGAFTRLRKSAKVSPMRSDYWYGRIVYYYMAGALWNLKHKQPTRAGSRLTYALFGLLTAGRYLLSRSYWDGIRKPHYNLVAVTMDEVDYDAFPNTAWRW